MKKAEIIPDCFISPITDTGIGKIKEKDLGEEKLKFKMSSKLNQWLGMTVSFDVFKLCLSCHGSCDNYPPTLGGEGRKGYCGIVCTFY